MSHWIGAWDLRSPAWLVAAGLLWLRFRRARPGALSGRAPAEVAHALAFVAGTAAFLLALVSPLALLAEGTLFSAHMVQHLLLLLVAPLLWIVGLPPARTRRAFDGPRADRAGSRLAQPWLGWLLGIGAMWFWHEPSACDLSVASPWVGAAKYLSLPLAGCAFWWPIFSPVPRYRTQPEYAVVYLFTACVGCTLLGIFLTFTRNVVCPVFATGVDPLHVLPGLEARGFTRQADQELGGLLMWVPTCMIYLSAVVAVMIRWFGGVGAPTHEKLARD